MVCDHIGFFTHNSESLVRFYVDVLGFERKQVSILPKSIAETVFGMASDCRFIKLSRHEFVLEIFEPLCPDIKKLMPGKDGINHWGYCVKDRAAFVDRLRKQGFEIIEVNRNEHYVYFLKDPDGNRIEIRECRE
jgi:catechol 2,3-dioxygenase-like lactoylglutathione lyase family enzyme